MIIPTVEVFTAGKAATSDRYCLDSAGFKNVLEFYAYGMDLALDLSDAAAVELSLEYQLAAADKTIEAMNTDREMTRDYLDETKRQHKKDKLTATITIVVSVALSLVLGFGIGYAAGAL